MLGIFPFVIMFLITSIAMLRERTSGTLERLLTTPDGQAGPAVRLRHRVRDGGGRSRPRSPSAVAYWLFDLDTAGSAGLVILIAIANAVLGVALGLFCSAFARTEFQAVQFMPVVVIPQMLLCGLFVAREQMAGWLQAISNVMPMTYAVEALQEVGAHAEADRDLWRDLGIVVGCVVRRPHAAAATLRRRDAPDHGPDAETVARMVRTGRRPGNQDTREAILAAARDAFAERGFDAASIRPSPPPPGSTRRSCTTTSAPRTSCSWPRCGRRSTRPSCSPGPERRRTGSANAWCACCSSVWDSPAGAAAAASSAARSPTSCSPACCASSSDARILRRLTRDLQPAGPVRRRAVHQLVACLARFS